MSARLATAVLLVVSACGRLHYDEVARGDGGAIDAMGLDAPAADAPGADGPALDSPARDGEIVCACPQCQACADGGCAPLPDGTACATGACFAGACCGGCLTAAACAAGDSPSQCGTGGAMCTTCMSGDSCVAGSCTPPTGVLDVSIGQAGTTCAVIADGTLACWGANAYGQLGVGDTTDRDRPAVVTDSWARASAGGDHVCGIHVDRSLACWGDRMYGALGIASAVMADTTRPVTVAPGTQWLDVAAGVEYTCAVRMDGTLWCWGRDTDGELGQGMIGIMRELPTQLGAAADWAQVEAAFDSVCALKRAGELFCWGDNAAGEAGLGPITPPNILVPARVGTEIGWTNLATSFQSVCATHARELWCWGWNFAGGLGLGDGDSRYVPTRVGTANDWTSIGTGELNTCGARADGSLWCSGPDGEGELGDGPAMMDTAVHVQVGIERGWRLARAGALTVCGIKMDGTLWCWGYNNRGQVGVGSPLLSVESPTLVSFP